MNWNSLDAEACDLSDFGLAISPRFDLSAAELDFAERNVMHVFSIVDLGGDPRSRLRVRSTASGGAALGVVSETAA